MGGTGQAAGMLRGQVFGPGAIPLPSIGSTGGEYSALRRRAAVNRVTIAERLFSASPLDRYRVPGHQRDGARASHTNVRLNQMTLYNLADYRARRLRSRAVPLHVEALAAYEQAEAYRARHLASAHVFGWGESSESDGPAAAPPWPPRHHPGAI